MNSVFDVRYNLAIIVILKVSSFNIYHTCFFDFTNIVLGNSLIVFCSEFEVVKNEGGGGGACHD